MTHKRTNSNVHRIDFSGRLGRLHNTAPSTTEEPVVREEATGVHRPPEREVIDLAQRRDEILGNRLGEIAGFECRSGTITLTVALAGDLPADVRWCTQLVCAIEAGGQKFSALVKSVRASECGKFVYLTTNPMRTPPTRTSVSPNSVIRLSSRLGWRLEAKFSELARHVITP